MHQTADQQSRQNDDYTVIIRDHNPPSGWRQVYMVNCGHRILEPVGRADGEWNKWRNFKMLADVARHNERKLYEYDR